MIRKNPSGDLPVIHESAYVDNTAILCGKIIVEENVFIGPYAVIRADEVNEQGEMEPIIIGANSNIQDGVVIHSKAGGLVKIGANTSIAHRSIVHGPCIVGENVFIGFNSVLFNCTVGNGSVVRHNSVVEALRSAREFPYPFHHQCPFRPGTGQDRAGFATGRRLLGIGATRQSRTGEGVQETSERILSLIGAV